MKLIIEKLTEWLSKLGEWLTKGNAPDQLYFFIGLWVSIIALCLLVFFTIFIIVKIVKRHKRIKTFPKVLIIKTEVKSPEKKSKPIKKETKQPRDSKGRFIRRK